MIIPLLFDKSLQVRNFFTVVSKKKNFAFFSDKVFFRNLNLEIY